MVSMLPKKNVQCSRLRTIPMWSKCQRKLWPRTAPWMHSNLHYPLSEACKVPHHATQHQPQSKAWRQGISNIAKDPHKLNKSETITCNGSFALCAEWNMPSIHVVVTMRLGSHKWKQWRKFDSLWLNKITIQFFTLRVECWPNYKKVTFYLVWPNTKKEPT